MRVLVTGACGFVGPYLLDLLAVQPGLTLSASVFSLSQAEQSRTPEGRLLREVATNGLFQLDVTDGKAVGELIGELKPDAVVHLAGLAFAPEAAENFGKAFLINTLGPYFVAQALADHVPQARLLYVSSGEVYGAVQPVDLPITEEHPLRPVNQYSLSKAQAEQAMFFFHRRAKLSTIIARPFNHIGPRQSAKFVTSSFAEQLALIAHGKREAVLRVGNLEAKRDFTDVRDIVAGYLSLLTKAEPGVYNLCSGRAVPILEILQTLIEISGVEVRIEQDPSRMRPAEVPEIRGSYDRVRTLFQWEPRTSLKDSLTAVYGYWKEFHR